VDPDNANSADAFPRVIAPDPPVPILIVPVLLVLPAPIAIPPENDAPFAIAIPPLVKLDPTVIPPETEIASNVFTVVVPVRMIVDPFNPNGALAPPIFIAAVPKFPISNRK
jgi:hypothetical protein